MRVGVIGLGTMGMGAALNLVRAGHETWGCELRDGPRAELHAAGGHPVGRAADLPDGLEALVLLVVTAAQAEDVLFGPAGCVDRLAPGTVVLCCVTVAPEAARALAARLEARGLLMLDAPVSGGAVGGTRRHDDDHGLGQRGRVRAGRAGARRDRRAGLAAG